MNHLPEFIEYWNDFVPSDVNVALKNSICFAMPSCSDCPRLEINPQLMRLPFEFCWVEGIGPTFGEGDQDNGVVAFYGIQKPDGFVLNIFTRTQMDGFFRWDEYQALGWIEDTAEWSVFSNGATTYKPLTLHYIDWFSSFLNLLNCANVTRVEHKPSTLRQARRLRQKKLPLHSYWTLDLDLSARAHTLRDRPQGTHASPRLHLRRGHVRRLEDRHVWVRACAVGNKAFGVVHKDYSIGIGGEA